jgi:CheY-like chemotaxis protein
MGQSKPYTRPAVLVVEDEPLLRLMALDLVEEAGLAAIEATNADEAIRILEARDDIRIIFTDIDMPGSMDGLRLAAAVRDRWPPVRIIVTSGQARVFATDLPQGAIFMAKPHDTHAFVRQLRMFAS